MTDILDYIREQFTRLNPDKIPVVDSVLSEVRAKYSGDTVYIRRPPRRPVASDETAATIARRFQVSKRTAQRWRKET
jgi:uncharacterized protein YdhG (YjbR/CyaY superfamily)